MIKSWPDYELIDFGNGKKLERFGQVVLIRPEVMAEESPKKTLSEWRQSAHAEFLEKGAADKGEWKIYRQFDQEWQIHFPLKQPVCLNLKLTNFKHIGVFPEQSVHWSYISEKLRPGEKFLNLFAYTGAASLAAKSAAADALHVESLKQLITWARLNMETSGMTNIRWVCEDALKFANREAKRGNSYKGIILDPPAFGRGPKGERWTLEEKFDELLHAVYQISERGGFIILNTYSPKIAFEQKREALVKAGFKDKNIQTGWLELCSSDGRKLNMSRYAVCYK